MLVQLKTEGEGGKFANQLGTNSSPAQQRYVFVWLGAKSCCKKCCELINGSINHPNVWGFSWYVFPSRRLEAKTVEIPTISDSLRAPLLRSFGYTQDFLMSELYATFLSGLTYGQHRSWGGGAGGGTLAPIAFGSFFFWTYCKLPEV